MLSPRVSDGVWMFDSIVIAGFFQINDEEIFDELCQPNTFADCGQNAMFCMGITVKWRQLFSLSLFFFFVGFQLCRCLYFDFRLDQILSAFQPTQQPHSENHNWSTQQIFRNTKFRTCFHSFYSFVFELNFAYIVILTFVELAKQLRADIWQCM